MRIIGILAAPRRHRRPRLDPAVGGVKQAIKTGDVIWTPPWVKHWHGAAHTATMTHIAIQDTVDGRPDDWLEHVTDDQYEN